MRSIIYKYIKQNSFLEQIAILLIFLFINACNDCADTTYYNHPGPNEKVKALVPYSTGEKKEFVHKSLPHWRYELDVINRFNEDWEYTRVEENATALGLGCEKYDPEYIYTTVNNQTDLGLKPKGNNNYSITLSLMLTANLVNFKEYFYIHDKVQNPYRNFSYPDYVILNGSQISDVSGNPSLNYDKIGPITVSGKLYVSLYMFDTIQQKSYLNDGSIVSEIYLLNAYYSVEEGIVRFVLPSRDTFDLVN